MQKQECAAEQSNDCIEVHIGEPMSGYWGYYRNMERGYIQKQMSQNSRREEKSKCITQSPTTA